MREICNVVYTFILVFCADIILLKCLFLIINKNSKQNRDPNPMKTQSSPNLGLIKNQFENNVNSDCP